MLIFSVKYYPKILGKYAQDKLASFCRVRKKNRKSLAWLSLCSTDIILKVVRFKGTVQRDGSGRN